MISRRPAKAVPPPEDEEEEIAPTPWWKTGRAMWLAVVVLVFLAFIFTRGREATPPEQQKTAASIGVVAPYVPVAPEAKAEPAPPPAPSPPPAPTLANFPKPPTPNLGPLKPPSSHPAMATYGVPQRQGAPASAGGAEDPAHPKRTGINFATATLPGSKASPAIDDTYMLMPGLLPCVLDTAIDSALPGPLMCHLPGPVYSPKGVVLMEAGTRVIGRYESLTRDGNRRLLAVSTTAYTPNGIWAKLAGPMSDDLGRTGLSGNVNNRYIERFGGAVILDLSQAALQIVQASVAKGGSTYLSFSGTEGLASQILQSEVHKPPILTKNHGETIAIWVEEPITFEDSYRLQARK